MRKIWAAIFGLIILSVSACSDDKDRNPGTPTPEPAPEYLPIAQPEVTLAPDIGGVLDFGIFDLAAEGFEQQEYFLSGTGTAFVNLNELQSDGFWEVEPAEQADYTTRVLVRRPTTAAAFNGTVIVEWMNVSAGFDTTPVWDNTHVEIIRQGYAWIGVTAQRVGVEGREGSIVPFHLKGFNPERYAEISHPGDSFSYDMFSQVAQAVSEPGDMDLMAGLSAERVIGAGQSGSAFALTTYINAVHPVYNPFDGYMLLSRAEYSFRLATEPQTPIATPSPVFMRTDLNVPVMTIQSETDLLRSTLNTVTSRQNDTDLLRLWEVAGTSHSDHYSTEAGRTDTGVDPSFSAIVENDSVQGFIQCEGPKNSGHLHYAVIAGLANLNQWIIDGTLPPSADYLATNDAETDFLVDELGNVLGGVRTPYVDAPAAVLSGLGQSGDSFCGLFGTTALFSADQMASLYIDESGYLEAVTAAANNAVAAGFLLQEDADLIIAWAPEQWRSQVENP
ncbi:MAG: alpha/beta hydrolase domain-containing protein [Halioglobus sp.]